MRKILSIAFLCVSVAAFSQDTTIDKGSGIMYFSGVPGTTPDTTYGAEIAINKLTRELYVYNRDSTAWKKYSAYSQSYSDPSGDPTPGPFLHINRTDGGLFQWTGAAWSEIATSTDDQTATEVPFTPSGNFSSTDAQAAIEEAYSDAIAADTDDQTLSKPNTNTIAIEDGNSVTDRSLMQELPGSNIEITTGNRIHFKETGSAFTLYFTEDAFIPDQEVILNRTGLTVLDAQGTDNYSVGLYKDQFYLFDNGTELNLTATSIDGSDLTSFIAGNYEFDVTQSITLADSNKVMAINSSGVFSAVDLSSLEGSGSTEVADGVTITGDGSGGSPFTVDTTLIATITGVADSGYVVGPASATDNAIARYDETTGKILQNSGVTIDDSADMSVGGQINFETATTTGFFISAPNSETINIGSSGVARTFVEWLTGSSANQTEFRLMNTDDRNNTGYIQVGVTGLEAYLHTRRFGTNSPPSSLTIGDRGAVGSYYIALYANASEQARINTTGLGVGVSDPDQKLEVNGDIKSTGGTLILNDANDVFVQTNAGTPESVVTADPGSLVLDTSNGLLSVKKTGTGSTGWKDVLQNGTNTLDENLTISGGGTRQVYLSNLSRLYIDLDGALGDNVTFSTDGISTSNTVGNDINVFSSGFDSDSHAILQHVTYDLSAGSKAYLYNKNNTEDGERGLQSSIEVDGTAANDLNFWNGLKDGNLGVISSRGNYAASTTTHFIGFQMNYADSTFSLFDSTLIFSANEVPVLTSGAITEMEWVGDGTNAAPNAVRTAYGTATITGDADGENTVAVTISPSMPDATYTVFLTVEQETGTFTAAELQAYVRVGKTAGGFTIEVADAIDNGEEIFIHWTAKDN